MQNLVEYCVVVLQKKLFKRSQCIFTIFDSISPNSKRLFRPLLFWVFNSAYSLKFYLLEKTVVRNDQSFHKFCFVVSLHLHSAKDVVLHTTKLASLEHISPLLMNLEGCFGMLMENGNGAFSLFCYPLSHSKQHMHGSWFEQPIFPFTPNALYQNCFIHWPSRFEEEDQNQFENFKAMRDKRKWNVQLKKRIWTLGSNEMVKN